MVKKQGASVRVKSSNDVLGLYQAPSFVVVRKLSVVDVTGVDLGTISLVNSNLQPGKLFFQEAAFLVCRVLQILTSLTIKLTNDKC